MKQTRDIAPHPALAICLGKGEKPIKIQIEQKKDGEKKHVERTARQVNKRGLS